jgi:hypothetical protein
MHANRVSKPSQRGGRRASNSASRNALSDKNEIATRQIRLDARVHEDHEPSAEEMGDQLSQPQPEAQPQSRRGRPKASRGAPRISNPQNREVTKPGRGRPPKAKPQSAEAIPESEKAGPTALDKGEHERERPRNDSVEESSFALQKGSLPATEGSARKTQHAPNVNRESSDAHIRSQFEELKRRYESLEGRHNELKEVAVKDAERNYERLRKHADENNTVAEKLITELKAELAAQKGLASRLELSENHRENLQAKVKDLDNSLSSARSEIKALTAKLAAARSTEAGVKVPGSALKANVAGKQASSIEVVQAAQAKEDLYGDLTGLIIRGMKHDEQEDVFDCIQTGKNGSKCSDRSPTEPLTINHHASPPFQACVRRGRCLRQLRRCAIHVQATTGSQSR